MPRAPSFNFYPADFFLEICDMSNDQIAKLIKQACAYSRNPDGNHPSTASIFHWIDNSQASYDRICERNRANRKGNGDQSSTTGQSTGASTGGGQNTDFNTSSAVNLNPNLNLNLNHLKEESISCAEKPINPTEAKKADGLFGLLEPIEQHQEPTPPLKQAATAAVEETDTVEQAPIAEQKPAKHEYPAEFEAFWLAYPRHIAKKHAFKAWKVAIKHTHAAMIIETAKEFAASMKREGRKQDYIPHPATWLNGDRWEDHAADDAVLPAKPVDRSAITDDEWERAVSMFKIRASSWDEIRYGGEPDMSYNQIPLHILAKHGYVSALDTMQATPVANDTANAA